MVNSTLNFAESAWSRGPEVPDVSLYMLWGVFTPCRSAVPRTKTPGPHSFILVHIA